MGDLDSSDVEEVSGLKPDSIYKPYSKEPGEISGIAALPLVHILRQAESQLSKQRDDLSFPKYGIAGFIIGKIQKLSEFIIKNQENGVLDYNKQEELGEIYEELASIKRWARLLGKTGDFDTTEVFQALKRFYLTQVGDYLSEYAHENSKDRPSFKPGQIESTSILVRAGAGKVLEAKNIGGASLIASLFYNRLDTLSCRPDDGYVTKSREHAGGLELTAKLGVNPVAGGKAPKDPFANTDVNIAGLTAAVALRAGSKNYHRFTPAKQKEIEVEDNFTNGQKRSTSETKSFALHRWFNNFFYGSDLRDFGILDPILFSGTAYEKRKIEPSEFVKILSDNGIDISSEESPLINITTDDARKAEFLDRFNQYKEAKLTLPASKRISNPSAVTGKATGSFSGGLLKYGKAQAKAEIGIDVILIKYLNDRIDIAKSELPALTKINDETPQHAFNNAANILGKFNDLDDEAFASITFDVLKDIKIITAQIQRAETNTEEIIKLFNNLHEVGLMSDADFNNEELRHDLGKNADLLKAYIMLAYCGFLAGAYELANENVQQDEPDSEVARLEALNKKYSGIANFVADYLWTGQTPANTAALERYRKLLIVKEPEHSIKVINTSVGGGISLGPVVDAADAVDNRKHGLNLLSLSGQVGITTTTSHPNLTRNKTDVTFDLTVGGGIVNAANLGKQLYKWFKKEPALQNSPKGKVKDLAKSAAEGLWAIYNAASDTDKMTTKAGVQVTPFVASGTQPPGSLGFQVVYNTTTGDFDFLGVSWTNTKSLGFSTADVTSAVDAALPISFIAQFGYSRTEKSMIAWSTPGTTSSIAYVRERCASFKDLKTFNDDELIQFLEGLKKQKDFPGLRELGQVALNNKLRAEDPEDRGPFAAATDEAGSQCVELNKAFNSVFLNATEIDDNLVETYKNTIKKIIESDDIKTATEDLNGDERTSINEVFRVWKSAIGAYMEMDQEYKKFINFTFNPQPTLHQITELQLQGGTNHHPTFPSKDQETSRAL